MNRKRTLALTMIVKNEETHIGTALEHARRFADQIVIVDTGSTDRTKQICAAYTDEILDFEWCDDFARARNFGIARCTADFIMWLDADDVVSAEMADKIAALMRNSPEKELNWDVLMLPYVYARDAAGNPILTQRRERIFRNGMGLFFEFPIHECLKYVPGTRVAERTDIPILHQKIAPAESSRERNLRILRRAVETDEYRHHPRLWRLLATEEAPEKAVEYFKKIFVEFPDAFPKGTLSELHVTCGRKLLALKRYDEALASFGLAIAAYPLWREPYFYMGQAMWYLKRYREALQMLSIAEGIAEPGNAIGQHNPSIYGGSLFLEWKFFAYLRLGMRPQMQATIRRALARDPGNARFQARQKRWGAKK